MLQATIKVCVPFMLLYASSTAPRSWSSETWAIDQQLGDTLELVEKVLCYKWSSLQEVKVLGVRNVLLRAWVK